MFSRCPVHGVLLHSKVDMMKFLLVILLNNVLLSRVGLWHMGIQSALALAFIEFRDQRFSFLVNYHIAQESNHFLFLC